MGALLAGLFLLITDQWGPSFQRWFDNFFYQSAERITMEDGRVLEVTEFRWDLLQTICLCGLMIFVGLGGISLGMTAILVRNRTKKQMSAEVDAILRSPTGTEQTAFPQVQFKLQELQNAFQHKEQLLREEASRKDDLIAYLAHDLKTPLTSVIGYLELLEEAPDMPVEQRARYTHIARDKALRLECLINDFFEITRYNIHEILLEWERIDLQYLLIQMKEEFYPLLHEKGNQLDIQVPEDLTVMADREKLARVVNNILKNAVAYSYPNTRITISAEVKEPWTVISVSNEGRTIPAQRLDRIFEKFYRLDEARATHSGGAGLGLAIAKEIITAHGGTISAVSAHEVTTFTVLLPLNGESSKSLKKEFHKSHETESLRLL